LIVVIFIEKLKLTGCPHSRQITMICKKCGAGMFARQTERSECPEEIKIFLGGFLDGGL